MLQNGHAAVGTDVDGIARRLKRLPVLFPVHRYGNTRIESPRTANMPPAGFCRCWIDLSHGLSLRLAPLKRPRMRAERTRPYPNLSSLGAGAMELPYCHG